MNENFSLNIWFLNDLTSHTSTLTKKIGGGPQMVTHFGVNSTFSALHKNANSSHKIQHKEEFECAKVVQFVDFFL